MLHYKNREDKLHILTLDRCLLEDIDQRLEAFAGLASVRRVTPGRGEGAIGPDDILALARDTVTSRVLIMDVRNHTLPQLQRAYSDIIRFNRPDFNGWCYTVLVGDGPRDFLHPSRGKKTLRAFLADLRINYSPAAFFGDPFLFYSSDELQAMALARTFLPERLSGRFEKYFRDEMPTIPQLRRYFRAADKPEDEKKHARQQRRIVLKKLISKIILDEFPEDKELVRQALSQKGYAVGGESVRCHIYPFYFEEHVLDCFRRAQEASNDCKL